MHCNIFAKFYSLCINLKAKWESGENVDLTLAKNYSFIIREYTHTDTHTHLNPTYFTLGFITQRLLIASSKMGNFKTVSN